MISGLRPFKIQQSCFPDMARPAIRSTILWPLKGIASRGSPISAQNSASYLCGKLFQPAKCDISHEENKVSLTTKS